MLNPVVFVGETALATRKRLAREGPTEEEKRASAAGRKARRDAVREEKRAGAAEEVIGESVGEDMDVEMDGGCEQPATFGEFAYRPRPEGM